MIEIPENIEGKKHVQSETDRAIRNALDSLSKRKFAYLDSNAIDNRGFSTDVLRTVGKAFEDKGYYVNYRGVKYLTSIEIAKYR